MGESVYQEQLEAMAQRLLKDYALGRLQVAGDVRFLSGDLLQFLVTLLDVTPKSAPSPSGLSCLSPCPWSFKATPFTRPGPATRASPPAPFSAIPTSPGTRKSSSTPTARWSRCASTTWATSPMW